MVKNKHNYDSFIKGRQGNRFVHGALYLFLLLLALAELLPFLWMFSWPGWDWAIPVSLNGMVPEKSKKSWAPLFRKCWVGKK